MAHIIEVPEKGMNADQRCDRCGAQAYVEVVLPSDMTLLFCGHHAKDSMDALKAIEGAMIADHRAYLAKLESIPAPV